MLSYASATPLLVWLYTKSNSGVICNTLLAMRAVSNRAGVS
jgi:hypothetical protein